MVNEREAAPAGSASEQSDAAERQVASGSGTVRRRLTPAAALARHVEWLEYALGAARAEEAARAGRLETATKKNREKRTARLADVRDEVSELTALLQGIHDLQARARTRTAAAPKRATRTTKSSAPTRRRRASTAPSSGG
jgi:hypothetical protein